MKKRDPKPEILTRNPPRKVAAGDRLFVGSLSKAVRVLYAFGGTRSRLTTAEIAKATGLNVSAAQRFAHSLLTLGWIEKDARTKEYRLSPRLLDLAYLFLRSDPLTNVAYPHLVKLAVATGEYINLSVLDRGDVIYLIRLAGTRQREQQNLVGGRMPSFCTSNGRAMLAFLPEEEAREIIEQSDRTPLVDAALTDVAKIMRKIREARKDGYAIVDGESEEGVISVAAPILDAAGHPLGAINAPVSTRTWTVQRVRDKIVPQLLDTAEIISRSLSGHGTSVRKMS